MPYDRAMTSADDAHGSSPYWKAKLCASLSPPNAAVSTRTVMGRMSDLNATALTGTAANWREVKQTKAPLSEMPPSSSTPGVKPAASVLMTPSRYQGSCVGEGESQRETVRLYSSLQGVELSIS